MSDKAGKGAADFALAGSLFAAAFLYLAAFPRNLGMADESYFLLEAARLRNGEVMYRDIFDFTTPLASHAMALLFRLFGTTIDTARLSTAALHGLTAVVVFAVCRRLAVRRALAAAAAVAYLTISPPAWPVASWHWFSTPTSTLVLYSLLAADWSRRPLSAFLPGVLVGLQVGIQQQKGLALAAAIGLLFLVDPIVDRRFGARESPRLSARRLGSFLAGGAAVVVPLLLVCLAAAGWDPLYDALVRYPLETYRPNNQIGWGRTTLLAGSFANQTFPTLLRYAPVVLLPLLGRAALDLATGRARRRLRRLTVLLLFAAASIVSILYYPDVIHIAFIAPIFLVCAAQVGEWSLTPLAPWPRRANTAGWLVAAALLALMLPRLAINLQRARALYPHVHDTAFGRVAFHARWEPLFIDHLRGLLRDSATREIYSYPNATSPYLTIGAANPTPYQFFLASFSPPEQTQKVLSILAERQLPYLIGSPLLMRANDPVVEFINRHYEVAAIPEIDRSGEKSPLWLYRRKATAFRTLDDAS